MTTATKSHDAQLASIKARHAEVRSKIADPSLTVGAVVQTEPGMTRPQCGLEEVHADRLGRLWRHAAGTDGGLVMFFDPNAARDDTQAAQGFKAHEG